MAYAMISPYDLTWTIYVVPLPLLTCKQIKTYKPYNSVMTKDSSQQTRIKDRVIMAYIVTFSDIVK